jgi:protein O-mannosyl-transferase
MLCKSTVVMLPVGLLLYAWWRRGRIGRRDLAASAPFFIISLGLGLLTVWFEHHQVADYQAVPVEGPLPRLAGAVMAFWFYLGKTFWPADLIPIYPRWRLLPLSLAQLLPLFALWVSAWWLRGQRLGWARNAVFGLGWFAISLAPMVGLVGLAYMRLSRVADHFAYLALLGPIGWGALAADRWQWRGGWRRAAFWMCATAAVAGLAGQSRGYAGNYRNEARFWTYTLERNPDAWLAHHNMGNIFLDQNRLPEAIAHYREAVQLNPSLSQPQVNWGVALLMMGRASEAIPHLEEATRLAPDSPEAENSLGMAWAQIGRADQAIPHHQRAVQLAPDLPEMRNNLGRALVMVGRLDEAIAQYREALRLRPDSLVIHRNLALALQKAGRVDEAMDEIEQVQQIERAGAGR